MRGEHKLLKNFDGQPLGAVVSGELLKIPFAQRVAVTGFESEKVAALFSRDFTIAQNELYETGLHSSIRTGIAALSQQIDAVVITLADQPFDLASNIERLIKAGVGVESLSRSVSTGKPGHPVLIGRKYFSEILNHEDGDFGCAYLFKKYQTKEVEQPLSATLDLDTPEDWASLRR